MSIYIYRDGGCQKYTPWRKAIWFKRLPLLCRLQGFLRPRSRIRIYTGGAGPGIVAVSKGPQSQFRYCWWYTSSHSTESDISEKASPGFPRSLGKLLLQFLGLVHSDRIQKHPNTLLQQCPGDGHRRFARKAAAGDFAGFVLLMT